jgi:hypothetical protein
MTSDTRATAMAVATAADTAILVTHTDLPTVTAGATHGAATTTTTVGVMVGITVVGVMTVADGMAVVMNSLAVTAHSTVAADTPAVVTPSLTPAVTDTIVVDRVA